MRKLLNKALVMIVALAAISADATGPFEEPSVRTEHEITVAGEPLRYTAETGRITIRYAETGASHGHMFYISYRVPSNRLRPRGRRGAIQPRYLKFGANPPWKRVRFNLGLGTNAANRAIKSSGSSSTWVEPSLNGRL